MKHLQQISSSLFRASLYVETGQHRRTAILLLLLILSIFLHTRTLSALAAPPTITSFTPASGLVGSSVTITGTNFTGATAVGFNGVNTTFKVISSTQITAFVSKVATSGPISVTNPVGTATSPSTFTVIHAPTISSFTPASGLPGGTVTITGTNFSGATAVNFNGVSSNFQFVSPTQLTAQAPTGATAGPISVTNPAGTATSTSNFTFCCLPMVTAISPTTAIPGAQVTINGAALHFVTSISFLNVPFARFTIQSDVLIIGFLPAGVTGTGPVVVGNSLGSVSSSFITVNPPPQ